MSSSNDDDPAFMRRALELARRGIGRVEPNPAVGAVIIDDERRIVGEGWHERFGGPHAEINALRAAGDAARGAILFVTLEPCCHFGKTPPCSRAVIAAGIKRVVIGTIDPAAHAAGKGIQELRDAGIDVVIGVLVDEARDLIAPFAKLMTTGLPWIHAKWAMTLDGKIATRTGSSKWISNEQSRAVVHELRGRMDSIVVGVGTVLADDPLLTARPEGPRRPARIVLDSMCRTPLNSQLIQTARETPVMIVTTDDAPLDRRNSIVAGGAELLSIPFDDDGKPSLPELLRELGRRRMTNVLIEGGSAVLGCCFDKRIIDEAHVFIAPKIVGGGGALSPVGGLGKGTMAEAFQFQRVTRQQLGDDVYIRGTIEKGDNDFSQGE